VANCFSLVERLIAALVFIGSSGFHDPEALFFAKSSKEISFWENAYRIADAGVDRAARSFGLSVAPLSKATFVGIALSGKF